MLLESIHSPSDVKRLTNEQTRQLCDELRGFLVEEVSRTGGHLASNLGAVELTVAIHRVFDTRRDRLVFDVGHQCYVHKILTGRRERFPTLRQLGGLSGFPKPRESVHDAFIAGHASNSVSVALGMAKARTLQGENYSVLALIGDGAMTGGLSFEGLNNAGTSGEPLIVILNDNGMSIAPNVGALSRHLAELRMRPGYSAAKERYRKLVGNTAFYRWTHSIKEGIKRSVLPGSIIFEDMGFTYLGPIDGHDLTQLTEKLTLARDLHRPVLLHVLTEKGRGYEPAREAPGKFHGVAPFDPRTGEVLAPAAESFSDVFGRELTALTGEGGNICAITAAMRDGTGLAPFAAAYPRRFMDVGIAEGHAVSMAAGMAKQGLVPVFAVYSNFLQRSYDMLVHDVALQNLHVVLAVDRAGFVGADGETHHGCLDVQYLSQIPGMQVLCPASFAELRTMLRRAVFEMKGPVALRYPRGGQGRYTADCGDADYTELCPGGDGTIVTYGILVNEALRAAELLRQRGIEPRVVKLNCIAPLSDEAVCRAFSGEGLLLAVEDCMGAGCVGQRLSAILARNGCCPRRVILKNTASRFAPEGKVEELYKMFGLDAESIADTMEEAIREQ